MVDERIGIKALRVNRGLGRNEVSQALDMHKNTLANYENFKTAPDMAKAQEIADYYGKTVDEIKWYK